MTQTTRERLAALTPTEKDKRKAERDARLHASEAAYNHQRGLVHLITQALDTFVRTLPDGVQGFIVQGSTAFSEEHLDALAEVYSRIDKRRPENLTVIGIPNAPSQCLVLIDSRVVNLSPHRAVVKASFYPECHTGTMQVWDDPRTASRWLVNKDNVRTDPIFVTFT